MDTVQAELRERLADNENHTRRAVRVSLLAFTLLILSTGLILHGASGLDEPYADLNFGNVAIAVEMDGPPASIHSLPFEDIPTFGVAGSFLVERSNAYYTVFFPEELVGKKFVILLEDAAVLGEVDEGTHTTQPATACQEKGGSGDTAYSMDHRCQILYGTVPPPPSFDDAIRSFIAPDTCNISDMKRQLAMPRIQIAGKLESPIRTDLDWAHTNLALPGLGSGMSNTTLDRWHGIALDGWYGTGSQKACKVLNLPFDAKVTDANPKVVSVGNYSIGWYEDEASGSSAVVAKTRGAEATGTILVGVGGILGGLAVGLVPVVYEAIRTARRRNRAGAGSR